MDDTVKGAAAASGRDDNRYKWQVLSTVVFGIFMVILDTTVVNVAFQTLRQDFGGSLNDTQWIISIYVLALGITTPLAGFLADRLGAKRVYLAGLGVFAAGSLMSGLSANLNMLIIARALQGAGGGIALPLGTALLLQAFPVKEQGMALGLFGVVTLVAPVVGPILGGWLVDRGLWRVIFFINPPIGLVGVLLGLSFLRDGRSKHRPPLDWLGILAESVGFGAILYAASIAANNGWTAPDTLLWFGVGAAGLLAFGVIELFVAREPLLDLRLFRNRTFLNASVLGYVSTIALFGAEFLLPIYLQALRGRTALQTGLILLPMALTGGLCVIFAGRLYDRVGPRPLLAAGFTILIVNTWQLSQLQATTPINTILLLLALRGVALGLTVQTTMVTALSVVPRHDLVCGSSLTNSTRLVVQSIGVAVLATVLASTLSPQIKQLEDQFTNQPATANVPPGLTTGICEPLAITGATGASLSLRPQEAPAPGSTQAVWPQQASSRVSFVSAPVSAPAVRPQQALAQGPVGQAVPLPPQVLALRQEACLENVAGFEHAYRITFYAAFLALGLGLLLPGWPLKWSGRQMQEAPAVFD